MGFGTALLGYAFLLMHEIGGAVLAALIVGYGFFLASRLNAKFMYAAVSALFMLPRGVVQLLYAFRVIDLAELRALNAITFLVFLSAWAATVLFWLWGVMEIAAANGAEKLKRSAARQLVFTEISLLLIFAVEMLKIFRVELPFIGQLIAAEYILQYLVILVNLFFLHTCFISITSKRNYERELREQAGERANELERRHREHNAEVKQIEKRRR